MHVFADLQAYICTSSSCPEMLKTFPSRKSWFEHETTYHMTLRQLNCQLCAAVCHDEKSFLDHAVSVHDILFNSAGTKAALLSTATVSVLAPVESLKCLLCSETGFSRHRQYATHLGKHLESISLASLPQGALSDEEDTLSSSEAAMTEQSSTHLTRRSHWLPEEDIALAQLVRSISSSGPINWVRIAQNMQHRSPKQCRERYHQHLNPGLNREPITVEEELIKELEDKMGKRWTEIARKLGNRSETTKQSRPETSPIDSFSNQKEDPSAELSQTSSLELSGMLTSQDKLREIRRADVGNEKADEEAEKGKRTDEQYTAETEARGVERERNRARMEELTRQTLELKAKIKKEEDRKRRELQKKKKEKEKKKREEEDEKRRVEREKRREEERKAEEERIKERDERYRRREEERRERYRDHDRDRDRDYRSPAHRSRHLDEKRDSDAPTPKLKSDAPPLDEKALEAAALELLLNEGKQLAEKAKQKPEFDFEKTETFEANPTGSGQSNPKRKRVFSNRIIQPCLTCRRRKKKCDEGQPQCKSTDTLSTGPMLYWCRTKTNLQATIASAEAFNARLTAREVHGRSLSTPRLPCLCSRRIGSRTS